VAAGVVHEDTDAAVQPLDRHGDEKGVSRGLDSEREGSPRGHRAKALLRRPGGCAQVDELGLGRLGLGVEAGEPEQILDDVAHTADLAADPLDSGAELSVVAGKGQARLRLHDRERGAQLVGGIGGEGELPLAHPLHRAADAAADREGADEDKGEEERSHHQLGQDDLPQLLPCRDEARPDHQASAPYPPAEEPERVSGHIGGDRRGRGTEATGQGRRGADRLAPPAGLHHPGEERLIEVVVRVDLAHRESGLGSGLGHPLVEPSVDRGGEIVGDQGISGGEHAARP
jgi:hypothetical protein